MQEGDTSTSASIGGDGPGEAQAGDVEVQDRLKRLETSIDRLWFTAGLLVAAAVMAAAVLIPKPSHPVAAAPADADITETQLLRPGIHCFSSSGETGAARQRALAAIDRYRWQSRLEAEQHPQDDQDVQMWGPRPDHPEGKLSIVTPTSSAGTDPSRCFEIKPPPPGVYLKPAQ